MDIEGATIVITGGSSGIGRATAHLLAQRGARVALAARRADRLDETVARLRGEGLEVIGVPTDIGSLEDVEHLADVVGERYGRVDVALFNAGAASTDNLLDPDLATWRAAVDTGIFGLLNCIKAFVPKMIAGGTKCAVYATTSGAGIHGTTYKTAPYATVKNAELSIMECLYGQVRDAAVPMNVGVVVPPLTRTNLAGDDLSVWEHVEAMLSKGDGGGIGLIEPEEFAHVVVEGIEQERFWIEATLDDDTEHFDGRYAGAIRRSRTLITRKADAMANHLAPDAYLW